MHPTTAGRERPAPPIRAVTVWKRFRAATAVVPYASPSRSPIGNPAIYDVTEIWNRHNSFLPNKLTSQPLLSGMSGLTLCRSRPSVPAAEQAVVNKGMSK